MLTVSEFCSKLKQAEYNKTLYVAGAFGAPMTPYNKDRYIREYAYNSAEERKKLINKADDNTFGFDCVCLIKGILWGWNANNKAPYGGATYGSNGVPDIDTEKMISVCKNKSTDFSNIEFGELVWQKGHVGVYLDNGLVVECTPAWNTNKVIFTNLGDLNFTRPEYHNRWWSMHGMLPWVDYSSNKKIDNKVYGFQLMCVYDGYNAVSVNGVWDSATEALAKSILISPNKFTNKNLVKYIQRMLNINETACDGLYGYMTARMIMNYQKAHNLEVDGVIGSETIKSLMGVK